MIFLHGVVAQDHGIFVVRLVDDEGAYLNSPPLEGQGEGYRDPSLVVDRLVVRRYQLLIRVQPPFRPFREMVIQYVPGYQVDT